MGIKHKYFDREFKSQAIKLALSSPQSIQQTAQELGIKSTTQMN